MNRSAQAVGIWLLGCAGIYIVYRLLTPYIASEVMRGLAAATLLFGGIFVIACIGLLLFYAWRRT